MTNVKLKLMFCVLNALLTADYVHTRPYLGLKNTTELTTISNDYSESDEFHIQVENDADTLIAISDKEKKEKYTEETNKSSKTEMDAIVNAEQDRDEAMSKKTMNDPSSILELSQGDADDFHKQLNSSTRNMEDIFDAETGREETLTDRLFKSESQISNDSPRFEFLIGGRVNRTDSLRQLNKSSELDDSPDRVVNENNGIRNINFVELIEMTRPTRLSENKSAYTVVNITGHEVENDIAPDTSFTDLQTLFLACFGTLVPLFVGLCVALIVRYIFRRCFRRSTASSSSESSEAKDASHQQLKSTPDVSGVSLQDAGDVTSNGTAPSNGSIITMTLKNNHLIVETEERNDIAKNGRETKMKYSPDNDGIFVVEVQQSTAYRPNQKPAPLSPPLDPQISTNQALIHRVAEELELEEQATRTENMARHKMELNSTYFNKEKSLALSNTGLSISDLSLSSIGSHNISYCYGSQVGYELGPFGYPIYSGYDIPKEPSVSDGIIHDSSQEPLISKTPTDPDKPVVTAAIFKQDSIIGSDILQGPVYCIEGSSDGPLLSDVQAREVSLQHLHDKMEKKLENGVAVAIADKIESPKKVLNRADSLPVRLENNMSLDQVADKSVAMPTIVEDSMPPNNKEVLNAKRPSLPDIQPKLFQSVIDETHSASSLKVEELVNEQSHVEAVDLPPTITVTEENDVVTKLDDSSC